MNVAINDTLSVIERVQQHSSLNGWVITFILIIIPIVYEIIKSNLSSIKLIYGFVLNLPLIKSLNKSEGVFLMNQSQQQKNWITIKKEYLKKNFQTIEINYKKLLKSNGLISEINLRKIFKKHITKVKKIERKLLRINNLSYCGFPHVPLGFFDGNNLRKVNNISHINYFENPPCSEQGFFELKHIYNDPVKIESSDLEGINIVNEVILKVEQSYKIQDKDVKQINSELQILKFSNIEIKPWGITNYAQLDSFKNQFRNYLILLKEIGIKKIHLVATTPTPLSFALGSAIEHHFPEIIVYNYCNGVFDWSISIQKKEISYHNLK